MARLNDRSHCSSLPRGLLSQAGPVRFNSVPCPQAISKATGSTDLKALPQWRPMGSYTVGSFTLGRIPRPLSVYGLIGLGPNKALLAQMIKLFCHLASRPATAP
jgi:hypothetical protein